MGDLTKNLSRKEFECNCGECGQDTADYKLVSIVQGVRDHFGASVTITSGNRCTAYNARIGGSKNSQHVKSRAADIQVKSVDPELVYSYLDRTYPNELGLGKYKSFTHIDTRNAHERWDG